MTPQKKIRFSVGNITAFCIEKLFSVRTICMSTATNGSGSFASARRRISWCLYDFGNSAFTTVIVTVVYSVYFAEVVAKEEGVTLWGRAIAFSMLTVAALSPLLGTLADFSGKKRNFLITATFISVFFTFLLYFVEEGDIFYGLLFFVLANISYNIALVFYDAFLKELTPANRLGRLSGYGWAIGYIGGFFSLLMVLPLLKGFSAEFLPLVRLSFVVTALFFLLFSLPTFIWVRDPAPSSTMPPLSMIAFFKVGFRRVGETIGHMRNFRELVLFFIAYFFYNDAINTIGAYASIFASKVLGFSLSQVVLYFIITQVSAAAGSFCFAPLTDRWGEKKIISLTVLLWVFIVVWAYFVKTQIGFYALGLCAGAIMGPTQAASRSLLARFAPKDKSAEFFGFFSLTGKISASLGPLWYAEMVRLTGSQRWATLSLSLFFLLGLLTLQFVDEKKGIAQADQWEGRV